MGFDGGGESSAVSEAYEHKEHSAVDNSGTDTASRLVNGLVVTKRGVAVVNDGDDTELVVLKVGEAEPTVTRRAGGMASNCHSLLRRSRPVKMVAPFGAALTYRTAWPLVDCYPKVGQTYCCGPARIN